MTLRSGVMFDPITECATARARRSYLGAKLAAVAAHAWARAPRFRRQLEAVGLGAGDVRSLDDLGRLPVTRKDSLPAFQAEEPLFGGLATVEAGSLARLFMSPGPIFDPQGAGDDFWRFRHALAATRIRAGDVVLNSASYHLTFTTKEKGTGLGLAVSYTIIRSFGGSIEVASQPGEGTPFTVRLPIHG